MEKSNTTANKNIDALAAKAFSSANRFSFGALFGGETEKILSHLKFSQRLLLKADPIAFLKKSKPSLEISREEESKINAELRERYPKQLMAMYHQIRASVPLMEVARNECHRLAAEGDTVAELLIDYWDKHIIEETGHDEWVLQDLEVLGIAREETTQTSPPKDIAAFVGPQYYWIYHSHPVALLGYCFALENYGQSLGDVKKFEQQTGYPPESFRTLRGHAEADVHHRRELLEFMDRLPLNEWQERLIIKSALYTLRGYGLMISSAYLLNKNSAGRWDFKENE